MEAKIIALKASMGQFMGQSEDTMGFNAFFDGVNRMEDAIDSTAASYEELQ